MATNFFEHSENLNEQQLAKLRRDLNAAYMRRWRKTNPEAVERSRLRAAATLLSKHGYRIVKIDDPEGGESV